MTESQFTLADLLDKRLAGKWRANQGKLSQFLLSVGVTGNEHSQSLYTLPVTSSNPERYCQNLKEESLDSGQWAILIGELAVEKEHKIIAFPVSKRLRIQGPAALQNTVLALFIEVHTKLVTWWLINAWRSQQLAEAARTLADGMKVIPAAACARSLIETAASVWVDARKIREIWSEVKRDCVAHGPSVNHRDKFMKEINKLLWGAKFDDKAPDLLETYGKIPRSNVLGQIEKLARATDYPLQKDYQWLCNAVHPSIGGRLAFAAPLMGHHTKTHAFQYVCGVPVSFRTIRTSGGEYNLLRAITAGTEGADTEFWEATIQESMARAVVLAEDVLAKTLDDALRVIDDIALTTRAPEMASFDYWRNVRPKRGNQLCPCRCGRKAKDCLHRWTDPVPALVEQFLFEGNGCS